MSGKLVGLFLLATALVGGIAVYYLQLYAFYREVPEGDYIPRLTSAATGAPEPILARDVRAIDADSSPLRFRACFTTPQSQAVLTETYMVYDRAVPLTGPGWFDCFDAEAVGRALEDGRAVAYLARAGVHEGVDRVVAVLDDGRAFAWHQLNEDFAD